MESKPNSEELVCIASKLREHVDRCLNDGAIREFQAATSATQKSDDMGERGSSFLDDRAVEFTEQSVACGTCRGVARLSREGSVTPSDTCPTTGHCELEWVRKYPDEYSREGGGVVAERFVCKPEPVCGAVLSLADNDGDITVKITRGECLIAANGACWRQTAKKEWFRESVIKPEMGIPRFDGQE